MFAVVEYCKDPETGKTITVCMGHYLQENKAANELVKLAVPGIDPNFSYELVAYEIGDYCPKCSRLYGPSLY